MALETKTPNREALDTTEVRDHPLWPHFTEWVKKTYGDSNIMYTNLWDAFTAGAKAQTKLGDRDDRR